MPLSAVEHVSGDKGRKGTTGPAQCRNPAAPVGWHEVLFKCLLAMCVKQVAWVRSVERLETIKFPFILIICALARVAVPLAHLVGKMWPEGEVSVRMPHGVRGHDALIVHGIRHRRNLGQADQHNGGAGRPGARVLDPHAGEDVDGDVAGA